MLTKKIATVLAFGLMSSFVFTGCGEDGGIDYECEFPEGSNGARLVGSWRGAPSLTVEGAAIPVKIAMTATPTPTANGTCALDVELAELQWMICGKYFSGRLEYSAAEERWVGGLTTTGDPANASKATDFDVTVAPSIGDQLALRVEITQSEVDICRDRTIQGDLPRVD